MRCRHRMSSRCDTSRRLNTTAAGRWRRFPPVGGAVEMSGLHAMSIGSLVATRSALLAVITLPPGYLVRLTGNRVSEVTAPSGEVVWPPQGAPSWPN